MHRLEGKNNRELTPSEKLSKLQRESNLLHGSIKRNYLAGQGDKVLRDFRELKKVHSRTRGLYYKALSHGSPLEDKKADKAGKFLPGFSNSIFLNKSLFMPYEIIEPIELSEMKRETSTYLKTRVSRNDYQAETIRELPGLIRFSGIRESRKFLFIDLETTSISPMLGDIVELGYVLTDSKEDLLDKGEETFGLDKASLRYLAESSYSGDLPGAEIHSIKIEQIKGLEPFRKSKSKKKLEEYLRDEETLLVAHNSLFEGSWLSLNIPSFFESYNSLTGDRLMNGDVKVIDTRLLSIISGISETGSLEDTARKLGIKVNNLHSALPDAELCKDIFFSLLKSSSVRF